MLNWWPEASIICSQTSHTKHLLPNWLHLKWTGHCTCLIFKNVLLSLISIYYSLISIHAIGWLTACSKTQAVTVSESATFFAKPANTLLHFFSRDDSMPQICSICVEFYRDMCHPDFNSRAKQSDSTDDHRYSAIFVRPLVMLIHQLINQPGKICRVWWWSGVSLCRCPPDRLTGGVLIHYVMSDMVSAVKHDIIWKLSCKLWICAFSPVRGSRGTCVITVITNSWTQTATKLYPDCTQCHPEPSPYSSWNRRWPKSEF